MDVSEMLARTDGDVSAVAAACGHVLAPWDRDYFAVRGCVICYPASAPPMDRDRAILAALLTAEAAEDRRASRVRLVSAG